MKQLQPIISFFRYLGRPVVPQRLHQPGGYRFFSALFICSFLADLGLEYIASGSYFEKLFHLVDTKAIEKLMLSEGILFTAFVTVILAPVLEEIRSRYYITSFRWNYAILPLSCCFILLKCFNIKWGVVFYSAAGIASALAVWFYVKLGKPSAFKIRLMKFYSRNYWLFFYCSALCFGLMHMGNFQVENFIPVLSVVIVIPQIFAGFILGYVRIVMGLRWSIAFHALHNLLAVVILFSKPS
jgi:hypothetical protein